MIGPEEIHRKALNLYPLLLRAWLEEKELFPRTIPANRSLDPVDQSSAAASVRRLREQSKEVRGFGYSVEWKERNSRAFGRNLFPERIYFETQEDLLRLIGKKAEFEAFRKSVLQIRAEFPELLGWIASNRQTLIDAEPNIDGLLEVLRYFNANPRPDCFARELPLTVDTKFIERNEGILRDWFDLVLPDSVHSHELHFAKRYGLRYREQHVALRFLDLDLQRECGSPWNELSLPLSALAAMSPQSCKAYIVENMVNLLTLPPRVRTVGLGGLGQAVSELRQVHWLYHTPICYWGDIDVEGFMILSALRAVFPHVRSILMDHATLCRFKGIAILGTNRRIPLPPYLNAGEQLAFEICTRENIRVEQERIPIIAPGSDGVIE